MEIRVPLDFSQVSAIRTCTDATETVSSYHILILYKIRFANTVR